MEVILFRHGRAEAAADCDRSRALTPSGRDELQRAIRSSGDRLNGIDGIWVSPYLRTRQTLEVIQSLLPDLQACPTEVVEYLTPCSDPQTVIDRLDTREGLCQRLLLVSHQPLLGTLMDELCGFEPGQYRLSTGSVAAIKLDIAIARGCGTLAWIQHPT